MIALLFISIGLFAYVSLHVRLIHSGLKLEVRMQHQEAIRSRMAAEIAKVRQSQTAGPAGSASASAPTNTSTLMSPDPKEGHMSLIIPDSSDGGFKLVKPENGLVPYYDSSYKPFMPFYNSGYIPFRPYYNPLDLSQDVPGPNGSASSASVTQVGSGVMAAKKIEVEEHWTDRNGEQSIVLETAVAPLYHGW